jgi:hypothetical protein
LRSIKITTAVSACGTAACVVGLQRIDREREHLTEEKNERAARRDRAAIVIAVRERLIRLR